MPIFKVHQVAEISSQLTQRFFEWQFRHLATHKKRGKGLRLLQRIFVENVPQIRQISM